MAARHPTAISVCVLACLALAAPRALAQYDDEEGGGSAVVIQDREFNMGHEFTIQGGSLPLDAFAKGWSLGGRYTLHFDDFNAWEIVGATYSFNLDTGLSTFLRDKFSVQAEQLPTLFVVLDSNYVMKPFYGKFVFFNQFIVYQELLLNAGATVTYWSDGSFRPGPDFGGAIRFFLWDWLSLRFDIRHALVMNGVPFLDENAQIDGILQLYGGVSFNVGGGE